jgi:nucleotide-binding universal stress UspA family protein
MFSRILIPTDGSPASTATVLAGIEFARRFGADVCGVFVAPDFQYPLYIQAMPPTYLSDEEYRSSMRTVGETYLNEIRKAAEQAGVNFSGEVLFSDAVAMTIIQTAQRHRCDLIFIGSHGRSGWRQSLLGSVTLKVLSACPVPVLVYRSHQAR